MKKIILLGYFCALIGCVSPGEKSGRKIATAPLTDFDIELRKHGLNVYFANLHAHHFISYGPPTKKEKAAGIAQITDFTGSGICSNKQGFPQDDGRPCRDNQDGINSMVPVPPDVGTTHYLKQACDYAREQGELDILFVTPHTKDNQQGSSGQPAADTLLSELEVRHRMLAEINANYKGSFLCGLGQEASSISSGNHIGIFGQFASNAKETKPLFFRAGSFDKLYPQIKDRAAAGEEIILQFNHPDFRRDNWSGDVSPHDDSKDFFKKHLRDYGLDDYAPMKCVIGGSKVTGIEGSGCLKDEGRVVTDSITRRTYAAIREAAGDRFRLIEVVPTAGATHTTGATFKPVRHRASPYSFAIKDVGPELPKEESDGPIDKKDPFKVGLDHLLYDYIYALNMGFRVGPVANQDNHHMNWGSAIAPRTGLLAMNLSESEVLNAMDNRRTFASEDRNTKVLFFLNDSSGSNGSSYPMGSSVATRNASATLTLGYFDPDALDANAMLRVYFYRAAEPLAFDYKSDPASTQRLLRVDQRAVATLPTGPLSLAQLRDPQFSVPIRHGQVIKIEVPLESGTQYMFAEITQASDYDKVWTAPIWVTRTTAH